MYVEVMVQAGPANSTLDRRRPKRCRCLHFPAPSSLPDDGLDFFVLVPNEGIPLITIGVGVSQHLDSLGVPALTLEPPSHQMADPMEGEPTHIDLDSGYSHSLRSSSDVALETWPRFREW